MKQWYAFLPAGVLLSFGVAGSLAAGMIAEGNSVLRWTDAAFQYLVLGSAVSFVFVGWKHKGLLESTTYALSLALFCAIPAREDTVGMFIFMSTFLLFACAALHVIWSPPLEHWTIGKFLLLGLAFALFETARISVFAFVLGNEFPGAMMFDIRARGTLGLGVGLALETGEWVIHIVDSRATRNPKRVRREI